MNLEGWLGYAFMNRLKALRRILITWKEQESYGLIKNGRRALSDQID